MQKNFDGWNIQKKQTHQTDKAISFYEREVWWSKIGANIGVEIDGKHEFFLRLVIVLRKFNKEMILAIPVTTQNKHNKFYFDAEGVSGKLYKACLSHVKTMSSKRLVRKIDTIKVNNHKILKEKVCLMIHNKL